MTTVTDPIDAARGLFDLIDAAAETDATPGRLDDAVVDAVHEAGLFRLFVPEALGGGEARPTTQLSVWEELSRADGSTGWVVMAAGTSSGFAGAFCGEGAVEKIFGSDRAALAGQLAPRGSATRSNDGIKASGMYSFGSGALHATYMQGGCLEVIDDDFNWRDDGKPEILAIVRPVAEVDFAGNWDVLGLRNTGSIDYVMGEAIIDPEFTYSIFETEPLRGGDLYRLGVMTVTAGGHCGWALGVGRRALDEVAAIARSKQRLGDITLIDKEPFQIDFSKAEANLRSARAFAHEAFGDIEDAVLAGHRPTPQQAELCRVATTWATDVAAEVVRFAYIRAGSDALRVPSALERCMRDIHAGTQHVFVDPMKTYADAGKALLAAE